MTTEYRSSNGNRLQVEANGRVVLASGLANLRALGCPDHLATRMEERMERRNAGIHCDQLLARAKAVGAQVEADKHKLAAIQAEAPAAPTVSSFVDSEMAKRLRQASGRTSR